MIIRRAYERPGGAFRPPRDWSHIYSQSEAIEGDSPLAAPFAEALNRALVTARAGAEINPHSESPIETILGAQLAIQMKRIEGHDAVLCSYKELPTVKPDQVALVPQYWLERFRFDFAIGSPAKDTWAFVECDGKEFHSTPDQLANDRKKDAAAAAKGIPVHRFTGRDIYQNGPYCASLVIADLASRLEGHRP